MNEHRRTLRTILVLALLLSGCASPLVPPAPTSTPAPTRAPMPPAPAYWPTEGWRETTPEQQGIDSEKLASMAANIQAEHPDLHSLLIVRNGYLVSEIYGHPYNASQAHWVASITKPVVSALVGIAIQQGKIEDVHQSLWSLLPQDGVKNLDENKKKITLEDLLTMTSGLECASSTTLEGAMMEQSENWVRFALDLPMNASPGTRYTYCSEVTQVLSAALQQAVGMSAREYANQVLFTPIGIPPVPAERWQTDPQGVTIGGYELSLTPRDMARFGFLYLHQGRWDGQQVIPAAWVTASTAWHEDQGNGLGYGYLWAIDPGRINYVATGRAGQAIFVLPEYNMLVVFTSGLTFQKGEDLAPLLDLLTGYILPAVKSDQALPANPVGVARLQAAIQALAQPRRDPPPLPATAAKISGKFFSLEKNPLGWTRLALTFPTGQEEAVATFDGTHHVAVGLDNLYRVSDSGYASFPTGLRGQWVDENTFVICQVWIGKMTEYTYTFRFSGDMMLQLNRVEKYFGEEINIHGALSDEENK